LGGRRVEIPRVPRKEGGRVRPPGAHDELAKFGKIGFGIEFFKNDGR
jgi:hypothetical protein